jgi:hypothetical protein
MGLDGIQPHIGYFLVGVTLFKEVPQYEDFPYT